MIPKHKIKIYLISSSKQMITLVEQMSSVEELFSLEGSSFDFSSAVQAAKRKESNIFIIDSSIAGFDPEAAMKRIAAEHPSGVIFLTTAGTQIKLSQKEIPYDIVIKPEISDQIKINNNGFLKELIVKIKILSTAKVEKSAVVHAEKKTGKVIAIGASTGGVEAIQKILQDLPDNLPGIVIVQHIPPNFSKLFSERLNTVCKMRVREVSDGDEVATGTATIAAGDKHMKIVKSGDKYTVRSYSGPRISGHCPSVDVMFESVAEAAGNNAIGIILTGMGADGAKGLLAMKKKGAYTIGQDKDSCVIYGMPMEAHKLGGVAKQIPLKDIAKVIIEWAK